MRPLRRAGSVSLWSLVAFLSFVYVSAIFGPPPPNEKVLQYTALFSWILVPWCLWIERTRAKVPGSAGEKGS